MGIFIRHFGTTDAILGRGDHPISRCRSRDVKPTSRRAEPVTSGKSHVLSERVVDTSCENNAGLSNEEVGGGTPDGRFRCLDYAGDTMHETDSCGEGIQCRQEPPYAEPHVRWCERTEAARPPPTRLSVVPGTTNDVLKLLISLACFIFRFLRRPQAADPGRAGCFA